MNRWIPISVDGWSDVAEMLSSTGEPWPEDAASTDLRWHVATAQVRASAATLPARHDLARRWGWSESAVRRLVSSPTWREPVEAGDRHRREADEWARGVAELQDCGASLPEPFAAMDLRWWQDRILMSDGALKPPSRSDLALRWGWVSAGGKPSEKRVRLLVADEARWSDPNRRDAWAALRASGRLNRTAFAGGPDACAGEQG